MKKLMELALLVTTAVVLAVVVDALAEDDRPVMTDTARRIRGKIIDGIQSFYPRTGSSPADL